MDNPVPKKERKPVKWPTVAALLAAALAGAGLIPPAVVHVVEPLLVALGL